MSSVSASVSAIGGVVDTLPSLADLSVGGANLVTNSGFDNAVGAEWTVGSNWVAGYSVADAF